MQSSKEILKKISSFFEKDIIQIQDNMIVLEDQSNYKNQQQTNTSFSEKWDFIDSRNNHNEYVFESFQKEWFLKLYGFSNEKELAKFLSGKLILDAGCGLGYKSKWFASIAKNSFVIGMDYSDSVLKAAENYSEINNLFFVQGDISNTKIIKSKLDIIICDQVIMHTEFPNKTFKHLSSRIKKSGSFLCYVYAKKALPRELIDDFFRLSTHQYSSKQIWELSEQLTELGKRLSDLKVTVNSPHIPLLGIKGGDYDLQRFIYWNFLKCFFNEKLGVQTSIATNFDWYSPSNAKRYNKEEFEKLIYNNQLTIDFFHSEEACYSGRFIKK
tara:strand:- start:2675 stop:3655 length:981 start_codon:yes stop_codon:yes gene_type:complete